jgi:RNA polymerase sigma-70 factor (ECF subfamily)
MASEANTAERLLERVRAGDAQALAQLFADQRPRLRRMVKLRMDRRVQGRIDPSDVLQEAFVDAANRLADYSARPTMPPFLWLRFLTGQRLLALHRTHLGAAMRDVGHEVSLFQGALPPVTSASLAAQLLGQETSPSQAAARAEIQLRIQEALNLLEPLDREVLALRHFEELTNGEVATVLGIGKSAASNRYVRALMRMKDLLDQLPGGL